MNMGSGLHMARHCTQGSFRLLWEHSSNPILNKRASKAQDWAVTLAGVREAKMEARSDCRSWAKMNWKEEPLRQGWTSV